MSEAPTTTAPAPEPATPEAPAATADLGDGGKKALEAERRRAATAEKQARELKAQLDAIQTANLSEVERAQKAATDAQSRLVEYERTNLRQKVALEKGVPASLVGRLVGDTEDEISADADALLALVNAPTSPKPDLSQGARNGSTPSTPGEAFAHFINQG
jgi:hypothetical protein